MAKSNSIGCGGLFPTLLTVLFVYLKLTHQIDWSWLWVLSPLWIPIAFISLIFIGIVALAIFCGR